MAEHRNKPPFVLRRWHGFDSCTGTIMDKQDSNIDYYFADIVTDKPHEFTIGKKHFCLYPVTLAKTFELGRIQAGLGINTDMLNLNPFMEALRIAEINKEKCCQFLAIHMTPNTKKDLHNSQNRAMRRNALSKLSTNSIAVLLMYVLTADRTDALIRHIGLDTERDNMRKVLEVKDTRNSLNFGAITILGTFVDPLMEMGYSDNEIWFERGYSYLRLRLADKPTNIYVSDEELKALPALASGKVPDANNPEAFDRIQSLLARKGIKINR